MVFDSACLAGVRAAEYRDSTDGKGEGDFGIHSEREKGREGLYKV